MNETTVTLSLLTGAFFGVWLILLKNLRCKFKFNKILIFIADFTFTASFVVVSYIMSIPMTLGRVRFLQVLLEIISMLSLFYALEVPIDFIIRLPKLLITLLTKITKCIAQKRQ